MNENEDNAGASVGTRWPELALAVLLLGISLLVITDSLRVGTGWADDGPRAGYFPFYIGVLLMASSGWILFGALSRWRRHEPFAEREQVVRVVTMLVPMTVYLGLIFGLGIYVASALLIGYFMARYGGFRWPLTAGVAVGVPLVFFLVFERWFLVPLPKGPLERMLGF